MPKTNYQPTNEVTEIAFPGGRVVGGRIRPDEGSKIIPDEKSGGFMLMLSDGSPGALIPPCECATYEGSCRQVTSQDDDGPIIDVYCESDGCGFCVGGLYSPDGAFRVRLTYAMAAN